MLKVGLTGGLACGKSFVGEELARQGCFLIQADEIGHEVLAPGGEAYDGVLAEFGRDTPPVGVHAHGYVARTDAQALEESWPHYAETHARIGRERGWPPMTREQYDAGAGPSGALFVGSPETVATKIVKVVRGLGLSRFDMKYSIGTLPHQQLMTSIELYGGEVARLVRAALAE